MHSIDSPRQKVKAGSPMSSHMVRELRDPAVRFGSGVCVIVHTRPNKTLQMSSLLSFYERPNVHTQEGLREKPHTLFPV